MKTIVMSTFFARLDSNRPASQPMAATAAPVTTDRNFLNHENPLSLLEGTFTRRANGKLSSSRILRPTLSQSLNLPIDLSRRNGLTFFFLEVCEFITLRRIMTLGRISFCRTTCGRKKFAEYV